MKTILPLCLAIFAIAFAATITIPDLNLASSFSNQLSSVTTGVSQITKVIESKVKSISKNTFNFFSINPHSYLQLVAPIYDFLPTISPAAPTSPKTPATPKAPLMQSTSSFPSLIPAPATLVATNPNTDKSTHIVNIFCTQKIGKLRKTVTGSGILINQNGTVLTNAHVAEFPFLSEKDSSVSCIARYGDPATGALSIKTVFISPSWIVQYGPYSSTENPLQTGKGDFAILAINMDEMPKPEINSLTPLPLKPENTPNSLLGDNSLLTLAAGQPIYSLSYPANVLGEKGVNANLPIVKENLSIARTYSLGVTDLDVIETSPSFAGQKGSSGGAIVDSYGRLLGMITTTVNSSVSGKANIRAITVEHINKTLSETLTNSQNRDNQNTPIDLYDLANYPSSLINLKTYFDRTYREDLYRYIK